MYLYMCVYILYTYIYIYMIYIYIYIFIYYYLLQFITIYIYISITIYILSIIHDISSSFDCDSTIGVRCVFLDISKAFDKVWHDGIILKLETYGIKGKLLNLINLHARYQRVVRNGQTSTWELIKSGVPQGSVLGPLMFLIYINDLPDKIQSTCKIFADDTSLFSHVFNKDTSQDELNNDLQKVSDWAFQ